MFSDAVIRIFTTCPERVAPEAELQAYEADLSVSSIPAQIGDIKTEDLVGPSALLSPGKRDGQTLMVRTDTCIEAHQWSESEQRWIKIGNVTGGTGGSEAAASSVKTHYQGKDYDYVFDVEIYEDKPPLKLPYNIGEDPWLAARNFLENNNISQLFLDQVANFIQQQTASITLGSSQPPAISDPFTGGSRYIPGGGGGEASTQSAADPFTGSTRYVPGGASSSSSGKLREYNTSQAQSSQQLTDDEIKSLEDLVLGQVTTSPEILELLWRLMQWPPDILLPVLDILRLVMRNSAANELFCDVASAGARLIGYFCTIVNSGSGGFHSKNQLLIVRVMCNAFHHSRGQELMLENGERLLALISVLLQQSSDKNLQVACVSFLLNLTIGFGRALSQKGRQRCLLFAFDIVTALTDAEAQFRLLVAVGTAIQNEQLLLGITRSLDFSGFLKACQQSDSEKLKQCAQQLHRLL